MGGGNETSVLRVVLVQTKSSVDSRAHRNAAEKIEFLTLFRKALEGIFNDNQAGEDSNLLSAFPLAQPIVIRFPQDLLKRTTSENDPVPPDPRNRIKNSKSHT